MSRLGFLIGLGSLSWNLTARRLCYSFLECRLQEEQRRMTLTQVHQEPPCVFRATDLARYYTMLKNNSGSVDSDSIGRECGVVN